MTKRFQPKSHRWVYDSVHSKAECIPLDAARQVFELIQRYADARAIDRELSAADLHKLGVMLEGYAKGLQRGGVK